MGDACRRTQRVAGAVRPFAYRPPNKGGGERRNVEERMGTPGRFAAANRHDSRRRLRLPRRLVDDQIEQRRRAAPRAIVVPARVDTGSICIRARSRPNRDEPTDVQTRSGPRDHA